MIFSSIEQKSFQMFLRVKSSDKWITEQVEWTTAFASIECVFKFESLIAFI